MTSYRSLSATCEARVSGLLLLPTAFEADQLPPRLRERCAQLDWPIALCGFGPIAAAARTAALLAAHQPSQVLLVGIAGSYSARYPVATATAFGQVGCWGVGVGDGADHQTAAQLGWPQWDDPRSSRRIHDRLPLAAGNASAASLPLL